MHVITVTGCYYKSLLIRIKSTIIYNHTAIGVCVFEKGYIKLNQF